MQQSLNVHGVSYDRRYVEARCGALRYVAARCGMLRCVTVCCSALCYVVMRYAPFGELCLNLTQCRLGRDLPGYLSTNKLVS